MRPRISVYSLGLLWLPGLFVLSWGLAATPPDRLPERALVVARGTNVNIPRPPLIHELITNRAPLERIEQLTRQGADINARDAQGNTVLHLIMAFPMATLPYSPPADWFHRQAGAGGWRRRAVQWLERHGLVQPQAVPTNVSVLDFVLRLGADPGAANALGRTPLHLLGADVWPSGAVLGEYREVARKLIAAGASLESRDREGLTPLLLAARDQRWLSAAALLELGARACATNNAGNNTLHWLAVSEWRNEKTLELSELIIRRLLRGRLGWEALNRAGDTPLHVALKTGSRTYQPNLNWKLIELLLHLGADPAMTNSAGTPAFHVLLAEGGGPQPHLERWIAANPRAVNARDGKGRTPLFQTLNSKGLQYDTVFALVKAGADPLAADSDGETFLHRLLSGPWALSGTQDLVSKWLPVGANVNTTNRAGDTLLHVALRVGAYHFIKPLIDQGADVLARNAAGETPLVMAHQRNPNSEAEEIRPPRATRPFQHAVSMDDTNTVGIYLRAEPRLVSLRDRAGKLPIDYAIRPPRPQVARQLLEAGSPLTAEAAVMLGQIDDLSRLAGPLGREGWGSLVFVASASRRADSLRWLLENGASANAQDDSGHTPLYYVSRFAESSPALKQLLEDHGARPNLFDAIWYPDIASADRMLADDPRLSSRVNRARQSPLLCAVLATNQAVFQRLLELGADVRVATPRGFTPLHAAAAIGRSDFVLELLARGADPRVVDEFCDTPLHWAARRGAIEVAECLLAAGANVNAQARGERVGSGNSPLHTAVEYFQAEMVGWLIANGASLTLTNRNNLTPLQHAQKVSPGGWEAWVWEPGLGQRARPVPELRAATIAALEKAGSARPGEIVRDHGSP